MTQDSMMTQRSPTWNCFPRFKIQRGKSWRFQKLRNNIITIDSHDTKDFARRLETLLVEIGLIPDASATILLELPGPHISLNGEQVSKNQTEQISKLLRRHSIQPVPGKTVVLNSKDLSKPNGVGYIDGNGDLTAGTFWPQ